MRRSTVILALLGLAIGFGARTARADGPVDYTVTGTYAAVTGSPSTSLSNPGDTFTFSFSVDPTKLMDAGGGMSLPIGISFDYTDSSGHSLMNQAGMITFLTEAQFGLFTVEFPLGGADFFLFLEGPDAGFNEGPPPTLNTGMFPITDGDTTGMASNSGSILGECDPAGPLCPNFSLDAITKGTVDAVATPEPSSLLLLGSGFIALGSFARRRLFGQP